jgi:hypothetical protein
LCESTKAVLCWQSRSRANCNALMPFTPTSNSEDFPAFDVGAVATVGRSFQNPFRYCGMTGPTHRCEPRQRLAVGTELRRCRQAARVANLSRRDHAAWTSGDGVCISAPRIPATASRPASETLIRRPRLGRDDRMDMGGLWRYYDYIPRSKISIFRPAERSMTHRARSRVL